jgi:hypothetical protein
MAVIRSLPALLRIFKNKMKKLKINVFLSLFFNCQIIFLVFQKLEIATFSSLGHPKIDKNF